MRAFTSSPTRSSQHGTVLVISLLVLIVMTILGVAVVNSSIMQTFMSSAYQTQIATLTRAENSLRNAELEVDQIVVAGPEERNYYFTVDSGAEGFPATERDEDWPHAFVIERIRGPRDDSGFPVAGESIAVGGGLADSSICVFRISARDREEEGGREGFRVVQTTYVTSQCPID